MKQASLDMIHRLVAFDTVSRNSNLALIDFVRDYLDGLGVASHLIPNADGNKANLFATVGPEIEGGIVLSGHTDVVPVDGQPWSSDPFTVTERDDKLYGRGTSDMKSFIALVLAAVPRMLEAGLKRPIHFALSYDEEIGCQGAPSMIDAMAAAIPRPDAVIIGEPSNMQPIVAHKGIAVARTTVTGHEAHSSQMQRGVSAVMTAARLITFLNDMMAANKANADLASLFVPPYTTIHVGTVNGGTAVNIISRECRFDWDIRTVPGDQIETYRQRFETYCQEILKPLKAISPDASIHTQWLASAPALAEETDGTARPVVQALADCPHADVVPYATEGGQFQERGFSVIVCGPGSIDQAHQPDEYIEIAQVEAHERFMDKVIARQMQ